jgi:hypothetical protein
MMLINNSTRYWTFSLLEEFKVRYEHGVWTVCTSLTPSHCVC